MFIHLPYVQFFISCLFIYIMFILPFDHPCIKGKFPEGGGEGKNNRTFAFWGRILGPATVFFGFLEGFWTIF